MFSLWPAVFVDDLSTIPAQFLNELRVNMSRAIDGANGGTYALASNLVITGASLILDALTVTSLTMSGTNRVSLASRSITRVADEWTAFPGNTARFRWDPFCRMEHFATAGGMDLGVPIHVPHGATLTEFALLIDPPAHGGSWPVTAPTMELQRVDLAGGVTPVGLIISDNVSNQANYEARHWFTSGVVSVPIDRSLARHSIQFITESGGNAAIGTFVSGVRVTYTTTAMDED